MTGNVPRSLPPSILILFYSYGHVYILLKGVEYQWAFFVPAPHVAPALDCYLSVFLVWRISRKSFRLETATNVLNLVGLFLLILPVFQLTIFLLKSRDSQSEQNTSALNLTVPRPAS